MLTIELKLINKFGTHSPMPIEHMSAWCKFFDLHPTTHYTNLGVLSRKVVDLTSFVIII